MTIGNVLALLGWVLFGGAFFLAMRVPALTRFLGGLAVQHRIHHYVGLCSAALLFAHGSFELISDPELALGWSDLFLLCGWIAIFLLITSTALAFARIAHRTWIVVHWTLAGAWILGFLHGQAFLRPDLADQVVFAFASVLAAGSTAAALMLKAWHGPWLVEGVKQLSSELFEVELAPAVKRARTFRAGTIVFARFRAPFSGVWHPFSVASCRFEPSVRLLIKTVGRDTGRIAELKPGDEVDLLGPFVEFLSKKPEEVWIAGGVGVAPFLGMTRCLDYSKDRQVRLFVFQTKEEPDLTREFNDFQNRHAGFQWTHAAHNSLPDFTTVLKARDELHNPDYLICGPPLFMKAARKFLEANGVPASNIKTEEYNPW